MLSVSSVVNSAGFELKKNAAAGRWNFRLVGREAHPTAPEAGALLGTLGFLIGVRLCRAKERSMAVPAVQRLIPLLAPRPYEL